MILLELSPGERRYRPVSTAEEFKQKTGISPVMKDVGVSCYCQKDDCLCQIDAKATAVEANLTFDIGDKHDYHSYCFTYDLKNPNPNWPSKTGNPSGKGRGNNI